MIVLMNEKNYREVLAAYGDVDQGVAEAKETAARLGREVCLYGSSRTGLLAVNQTEPSETAQWVVVTPEGAIRIAHRRRY